jgi:sec-independent protein translocase protein TatA
MPKLGTFGLAELLILLFVVLMIFGPKRLPAIAKGIAQSIREFRQSARGGSDAGTPAADDATEGKVRPD